MVAHLRKRKVTFDEERLAGCEEKDQPPSIGSPTNTTISTILNHSQPHRKKMKESSENFPAA